MVFFQCAQHRPALTMSKLVYVLYICTYWWWSSFHLYYQQKADWQLTLSKSLYLLLQWWWSPFNLPFFPFCNLTTITIILLFGDGPKSTKEGWQKFLLSSKKVKNDPETFQQWPEQKVFLSFVDFLDHFLSLETSFLYFLHFVQFSATYWAILCFF